MAAVDVNALKAEIRSAIITRKANACPITMRLAWHASGTYSAETKKGGSNGATMYVTALSCLRLECTKIDHCPEFLSGDLSLKLVMVRTLVSHDHIHLPGHRNVLNSRLQPLARPWYRARHVASGAEKAPRNLHRRSMVGFNDFQNDRIRRVYVICSANSIWCVLTAPPNHRTFAGKCSVEFSGGPAIAHQFGRTDAADGSACPINGRVCFLYADLRHS